MPVQQTGWASSPNGGTRRPATTIDLPGKLAGFQGRLTEIGLPSLLSILETERRTGTLVLELQSTRGSARLYLRKGRVLRAHLDSGEGPRNAELVYRLIASSRGTFDFRPSQVGLGDDIRCSTAHLILESVRRLNPAPNRGSRIEAARLPAKAGLGAVMATVFVLLLIAAMLWSGPWTPGSPGNSSVSSHGSTTP